MPSDWIWIAWVSLSALSVVIQWWLDLSRPRYPVQGPGREILWITPYGSKSRKLERGYPASYYPAPLAKAPDDGRPGDT